MPKFKEGDEIEEVSLPHTKLVISRVIADAYLVKFEPSRTGLLPFFNEYLYRQIKPKGTHPLTKIFQ